MENERMWILLAKKKNGEATADELFELEKLMLAENKGYSNELIEKIWEAPLHSLPEMKLSDTVWQTISETIKKPSFKVAHLYKKWMAAAVIIGVLAAFAYFFTTRKIHPASSSLSQRITTTPSSRSTIKLPDGTEVWLNSNSQLLYNSANFSKQKREVVLSGEAFFDVVKNEKVPFIIHAANVNITVKGTAFNVKAYPSQKNVETTLLRGLIEITTRQEPDRKIMVKPNEKIIIPAVIETGKSADKQDNNFLYTISKLKKDERNIVAETAWMSSKLEFNNESFEELSPKLESWFSVEIHINDTTLQQKRFSGLITKETLIQTLQALQLSYRFAYTIKGTDVWINKK
jgi:transmembrane sensor